MPGGPVGNHVVAAGGSSAGSADDVRKGTAMVREQDTDASAGIPAIWRLRLIGAYIIVLNLAIIYVLVRVWPERDAEAAIQAKTVALFGLSLSVSPETSFMLIALLAGALGSYIHLATSFADYVGNRQFRHSWTWWYVLRPFIGMSLGVLVYFALRGGLLVASAGPENLSPYGVGAISGLAGMFSKQATDKLREVFENLFTVKDKPERLDALRGTTESETE